MVTTIKGNTIDINETTEWLLFYRMTKRVNPIDFLTLTDGIIQLPNFLFSLSLLVSIFTATDNFLKIAIPCAFYFIGQLIVNLRIEISGLKWLQYPLLIFSAGNIIFMSAVFIVSIFFLGYLALLILPCYLMTLSLSVVLLNYNERNFYKSKWNKTTGYYDIFKNNAFFLVYKYYAEKFELQKDVMPTAEEIRGEVWLNSYEYMKSNWKQMESNFNNKAKDYWKAYLQLK